jgi:hypothetical protein
LDALGVAEAAYYLGVGAIRQGQLEEGLSWMERASALNPNHPDTQKQIDHLHQALGLPGAAVGLAIPLEEAVMQVAADLGLEAASLLASVEEDSVGGFGSDTPSSKRWPGGSVWEAEGKLLYALARATQPKAIVEVGSKAGCSASHLALACCRNGQGKVYAVDPALDFSTVDPTLLPFIVPVRSDIFAWTPPERIDFLFEDGEHSPGFTRGVLQKLRPFLNPNALVLCHDICQRQYGLHIAEEFAEAMGEEARAIRICPSDCGLGYARYAPNAVQASAPVAPSREEKSQSARLKKPPPKRFPPRKKPR